MALQALGVLIPSPAREMMPEVLCCKRVATAVTPKGSSRAKAAARLSCTVTANSTCPAAQMAVAPSSGGWTMDTSSPASSK